MGNLCADYKILLDTFSYEKQINEINKKMSFLTKNNMEIL